MRSFRAPWGALLIGVSAFSSVLLVGVSVILLFAFRNRGPEILFGIMPLVIFFFTLPFMIRGYRLESGRLYVQRLLWATEVQLDGLKSVEFIPDAMRGSLRSFGNGGLFSFTGLYYSKSRGKFRAWVTDLKKTVVLQFDGRAIVVSPDDPEAFAAELKKTRRLS